jgi:glycosyltransferase involved in cell wall biosynthesis
VANSLEHCSKSVIIPIILDEKKIGQSGGSLGAPPSSQASKLQPYLLFVGGNYFGNIDGISWFAEHVSPYISFPVVIVGQGMELYRRELERFDGIHVIGSVEQLGPWYANSLAAIAPVFGGSGMKTKVAEALAYGKVVFASDDALPGYAAAVNAGVVVRCSSAGDFVRNISKFRLEDFELRRDLCVDLFRENYSMRSAVAQYRSALASLADDLPAERGALVK